MDKFKTTIELNDGKIIIEETEEKTREDCEEYWKSYIQYWSRVHKEWNCATVLKIENTSS